MISKTSEYALRAVIHLARETDRSLTTRELAETTSVPAGYLSKVLQSLGRSELVVSQRGLGGGHALARAPEAITVLDVVNAVDPIRRITECPLGLRSHRGEFCALHRRLDRAVAAVEKELAGARISELVDDPVGVRRAKELSFTARTFRGPEAVELGVANASVPDKDALDRLVAERAEAIAANSRQAVAAMKKLYGVSQEGRSLEEALEAELALEFPEIRDTSERLSKF